MKRKNTTGGTVLLWAALLNFLLFLPHYLWFFQEGSLWPFSLLEQERARFLDWLFLSTNHNPFRICGEFLFASILYWWVRKGSRHLRWLFILWYLFYLSYQIYHAFYQKVFGIIPVFLDDWLFMRNVLPVFFSTLEINNGWSIFAALLVLVLLYATLVWLLRGYLSRLAQLAPTTRFNFVLSFLVGLILYGTWSYRHLKPENTNQRIQWITPRILASTQVNYQLTTAFATVQKAYGQYLDCPLATRKNVYHLFLESYGNVAYLNKKATSQLSTLAFNLQDSLERSGWKVSSAYSVAPIKGGRSWLSFTTALTGVKIQHQYSHDSLLNVKYDYPHIASFFNQQGYSTHRISTFRNNQQTASLLSREKLNEFWHFDNILLYDDFPYRGYGYDAFGGMPDQYAMGYFRDSIQPRFPAPHYLFFITTTSHSPFSTPPPITEDWRLLDTIQTSPMGRPWWVNVKTYWERYQDAMSYNLTFWVEFIRKYGTEDDIFIISGDHQPPGLEYLVPPGFDQAAVPFHVISKDATFTNSFLAHGLNPGLQPSPDNKPVLRHEGVYSLLLHHLYKVYGSPGCTIPEYLPEGIKRPVE